MLFFSRQNIFCFLNNKQQTKFNVAVIKELVYQGKLSPTELKKVELVTEGVKISNTAKTQVFTGFGEKPLKLLEKGDQTQAVFRGINILQSPRNLLKLRRRVGAIGGSLSQNPQLKLKYQKQAIHDIDIDVRSDKIAQRGSKTVLDELKFTETDNVKFSLTSGRGTKVQATVKGEKPNEIVEFLTPKDALKGNKEALQSGLRFGQKYRTDKLSSIFKRPIKEK